MKRCAKIMRPTSNEAANETMRMGIAVLLIVLAAGLRLLPHPPNFSPIAAMALFGGAFLSRRSWSILFPLAALFLSDLALGFHITMPAVYVATALVALLGRPLRAGGRTNAFAVAGASVIGSLIFFVITNFAVWAQAGLYPQTSSGLMECFVAAVPFLQNSLAGDFVYAGLLFGAWAWLERGVPALRAQTN